MINGVMDAQRRWEDSLKNFDLGSMQSLLDEEDVQTDYRGVVQDGATWLQDFQAAITNAQHGAVHYAFSFSDEKLRDFGDTAIVAGHLTITEDRQETHVKRLVRFTNVWVKRSGDWKLVSYQATPVQ